MEAAMISECALSCVCACFFVPVLIACVNVCCIVRSILKLLCKSARVIFWWMTLLRYIRGPGLLLLETENSFHSCWVIVCVYVWYGCVCVLTLVMDWQPLLQGPWKNSSSLIQLPQRVQLEGQQEARGHHGLVHTGFLTQGWTKRPISSETCTYKLDFTFLSFSP